MTIKPVPATVDFVRAEHEVLDFWKRSRAFETLREKNAGNPTWSFMDGPITANNPMGVHHAWGRTYKDTFQRYFAGLGRDLRYQNGFDCQGLWVEVEVEKANGFKSKRDIEEYGIDKFVEDCKARVLKYSAIQAQQSQRLGYWMDWTNSYYTMSDENNYSIWRFLRVCHEQGHIYKSIDVMPWCGRCGTGLSHMELSEGYKSVIHTAVFVDFPIREREGESLLVWTTTPWTLTSNVAAAVSSKMTYLRVRAGKRVYYVAKGNWAATRTQPGTPAHGQAEPPNLMPLKAILRQVDGKEPEVLGEVSGAELVGLTYDGPYDDLDAAQPARTAHRIVDWDHVTEGEGSGIVHIAPGCGGDDYRLGQAEGLPNVAPLEETGTFKPGFGSFSGRPFTDVSAEVVLDLKTRGRLVAKENYFHRYPHCWRCSSELAYRLVDEWFISMRWREDIMEAAKQATWIPSWGLDRELDWLKNMGDWMISKKRYWGLALPIWECGDCGHFDVVRDKEDLRARATSGWESFDGHSPHRPWVDAVTIRCEKCGNANARRVRDVGNPWLDASIVPFSTLPYFTDRAYFDKWFPADFVVESLPGQFRNWFYALLAVSAKLTGKAPFRALLGHGLVLDEHYEEMHKSKGNAIWFDDAVDTIGADVMRWMYCSASPEQNLAFGSGPADEKRRQIVLPLWNVYRFFANLAAVDEFRPDQGFVPVKERSVLDRWILSELQTFLEIANRGFSTFNTQLVCQSAERFVERLANWYLRSSRRRFYGAGWELDKRAAYHTLYEVLDAFIQAVSPVLPFVTEQLYQNLVRAAYGEEPLSSPSAGGRPGSVHHRPFPQPNEQLRAPELDARMNALLDIVAVARAARNANRLKTRQPLAKMIVVPRDEVQTAALQMFEQELLAELNVKAVEAKKSVDELRTLTVKLDFSKAGPRFGKQVKAVQRALEAVPSAAIQAAFAKGEPLTLEVDGASVELPRDLLKTESTMAEGWVGHEENGTTVLLDSRITPEIAREGVARELTRNLQLLRKTADLQIEERVVVGVTGTGELLSATIAEWRDEIAREVLAVEWRDAALDAPLASSTAKVADGEVQFTLARAPAAS